MTVKEMGACLGNGAALFFKPATSAVRDRAGGVVARRGAREYNIVAG
jgi:hypothetical protein